MRWTPRWVAEAVVGAAGRAGRLHAGRGRAVRAGQPGRGGRQPAGRAGRRARPRCSAWPAGCSGWCGRRSASLVAAPAAWSAGWIIAVARRGADVPDGGGGLGHRAAARSSLLTALCLLAVPLAPRLLRPAGVDAGLHRAAGRGDAGPAARRPAGRPTGWVLAMCDVGQGDGLVLRAGPGRGGGRRRRARPGADGRLPRPARGHRGAAARAHPLPRRPRRRASPACWRAGGWARSRAPALLEPADGRPARSDAAVGRDPAPAAYGLTRRVGEVTLQTVWPRPGARRGDAGESAPNNASVVLARRGARACGSCSPATSSRRRRRRSRATCAGLRVDVLKVPHHGSRHQDLDWLTSLGARLALVSVGADNDYGHPAPDLLAALVGRRARRVAHRPRPATCVVVVRDGERRCRRPRIGLAAPWLAPPPPRRSSATSSS